GSCLARDQKNAPGTTTVNFRDPAALVRGIELSGELGGDGGDQRLELLVPAVLLEVQRAVALDDPAHVPGAVGPKRHLRRAAPGREGRADRAHRLEQRPPTRVIELGEHGPDLLL